MIGGQENTPWIINKQEQFHPREPHHGVDGISAFVESGDNSSTGLTLHIVVQPLVSSHLVHVVLQRSVRGHGSSRTKNEMANVHSHAGGGVDSLSHCSNQRGLNAPHAFTVAKNLEMVEVRTSQIH